MKSQLKTLSAALLVALGTSLAHAGAIHDASLFTGNTIPANDDSYSGLVAIGFNMNFYGTSYSNLYVNNNGNTTFTGPLSTYTPFGITGVSTPMLAPFFADVDTRADASWQVTYGASPDKKTFCVNCRVHCYKPDMREKIRAVMRFSGPRMIFYHPVAAIRHVVETKREKKRLKRENR